MEHLINKLKSIDVTQQILKICKKYKYWCINEKSRDYDIFMFGVRASNRDQTKDSFDDVIGCLYPLNGVIFNVLAIGTTDPGRLALTHPRFPEAIARGAAIMMPDQYRGAYKLGHFGTGAWRHIALLQIKPVKMYRDANRDVNLDLNDNTVVEMNAGLCIHGASLWSNVTEIGLYSDGCQVIQDFRGLRTLQTLWQRQVSAGLGDIFSYTLFNESDFKFN